MAISTTETSIQLKRRLFSVEEYYRMAEVGILAPAERVELRKGVLFTTQPEAERLFTVDEYYRMGETGILKSDERVELIDGEVIVMSPIGKSHAWTVDLLAELLMFLLVKRARVRIQNPVRLSDSFVPQPDLAVLKQRGNIYKRIMPTADDVLLLIEVFDSTLQEDRAVKMPRYAQAGVPEYWIVNLQQDVIEIYSDPTPAGYDSVRHVSRGETIALPGFPDLQLSVDDMLN